MHNINARKYLTTAGTKLDAKLEKEAITNIYNMMSLVDDLGNTCYYGIETYVKLDYNTLIVGGLILENVLYNAGFMFTDIIEIVLNDASTVPSFPYYVGYRAGDFLIRFFYKDSTQI